MLDPCIRSTGHFIVLQSWFRPRVYLAARPQVPLQLLAIDVPLPRARRRSQRVEPPPVRRHLLDHSLAALPQPVQNEFPFRGREAVSVEHDGVYLTFDMRINITH